MSATWLDGGLATTLQRRGLAAHTPIHDWLLDRPDEVRAAHAAFVDAGSAVVLAGTFRALPHVDRRWPTLVDRALDLATAATAGRAEVWCALGPASTAQARYADLSRSDRLRVADGWVIVATRSVRLGARGVVLETFVDPGELLDAARLVRKSLPRTPLVACLVPDPLGRLLDGSEPREAARALLDLGVDGVGFNCGEGLAGVEAALDRCVGLPAKWWAKPAAGEASTAQIAGSLRRLAARCTWVGGCCGVGPEAIAAACHGA